ncbi:unnamed protein product [Triticum turgidum subsp. durum]|uniref:Glycosyltransferase 61 catalytic domain-containing protein n=1 Tax=Triticum turgidum subsp. durum TaxID=4567 RepID=A0A9R0R4R1_TRITD|nr:unnamed protein product [Triticum turgidum subsp. durum]
MTTATKSLERRRRQQQEVAMQGSEVKPGRSQTGWVQKHLNVGLVFGGLLMLLTYLVARHLAVSLPPHVVIREVGQIMDHNIKAPHETENGKVVCSTAGRSYDLSDTCQADGDVRTNGTALSVTLVPASGSELERREWMITPYSRKLDGIRKVTVTQLQDGAAAVPCTVTHDVPAVLFAIDGYAGNYWHDYSDILVPLFIASRRYHGEVMFLITNIRLHPQWPVKYRAFLRGLSKYDAVDMDGDAQVRCFPRVTVGLRLYKELSIVPELVPGGRLSMADFTRFLRETYALPRAAPVSLARDQEPPHKKPRLLLIHRGHYRRILNEPEIARAAVAAGFEAVVAELRGDAPDAEQARVVNSFDVVLGIHGAGLTNALFLPPGGVLIQVVPYGKMGLIASTAFGWPAADMGLGYFDYDVSVEETSLLEALGPEHPAIKDPDSVHRSGWPKVFELYLAKQDVRINATRFAPTLGT